MMFVLNGVLLVQAGFTAPLLNQFVLAQAFVSVPQYTHTAQAEEPVLVSVPLNVAEFVVKPVTGWFWMMGVPEAAAAVIAP
jgi:hypothetical protein